MHELEDKRLSLREFYNQFLRVHTGHELTEARVGRSKDSLDLISSLGTKIKCRSWVHINDILSVAHPTKF